jgi:hypothetical protein
MGEKDRMRPTKMLPVCLSLREFQELDTSAQALQSQLRPHHVFTRFSKKTTHEKANRIDLFGLILCRHGACLALHISFLIRGRKRNG